MKEIDIKVQEAQTVPNKLDPKRTTPKHIIIKISKKELNEMKITNLSDAEFKTW